MVKTRTQYHHAVRRLKRKGNLIRASKLFEASMEGDLHLLKEMKAVRGRKVGVSELPETVEGANGEEEIVEKFRGVYSSLYNSSETETEMSDLMIKVSSLIGNESVEEVRRVNGAKVKEAVSHLKPQKSDFSGGFTSDGLLYAPDILRTKFIGSRGKRRAAGMIYALALLLFQLMLILVFKSLSIVI